MGCHPTIPFLISGSVAAAAFSAPPTLTAVAGANAVLTNPVPMELMSVTLSSTLTNFGTANMGVFVLIGQNGNTLSFATSTPALIGAVTGSNSIVGPPAVPIPSYKVATTVFLQPILVPPNTKIQLFAFGDNTAGNALFAVASLVMRQKS